MANKDDTQSGTDLSRRKFLGGMGLAGVGIAALGTAGLTRAATAETGGLIDFHGTNQAGIGTAVQDRMHIVTFDLITDKRDEVRSLLQEWSAAAALLCSGKPVGTVDGTGDRPPGDTGEQVGHKTSHLTITIGFGPSLFLKDTNDRYGLAAQKPATLAQLPTFSGDALSPEQSGGDLVVQACSDDAQVLFHAVHNMIRIARGVAITRWTQVGFGRASSTDISQTTPRNVMGTKIGTDNVYGSDDALMNKHVWVNSSDGTPWLSGGTYMVCRRIRVLLEIWDRTSLNDQEHTIGRRKATGAPLGKLNERDPLALNDRFANHSLITPADSHVRLAHPDANNGIHILRRGYSYSDDIDPNTGELDAGLFFISFQRDIAKQFIPIQQRLAQSDRLNNFTKHTSSAVFAIPPGTRPGGYVGETLFR